MSDKTLYATTWPEQDWVEEWCKRHGLDLTFQQKKELKDRMTAPRIELDKLKANFPRLQRWRCSIDNAEDTCFFGHTSDKHGQRYDPKTRKPLVTPLGLPALGSHLTVEAETPQEAMDHFGVLYLYDRFDETQFDVWVRNDADECWQGSLEMTGVDEWAEEVCVSDLPCDLSEANSSEWSVVGEITKV